MDADRYLTFDAAELLARFTIDGVPEARLFEDTVGSLLRRAGAGRRRVRVYGEMVALLFAAGDTPAAIMLEGFWNDLAEQHDFGLLCAYPMSAFKDAARADAFRQVCGTHNRLHPRAARQPRQPASRAQAIVALAQSFGIETVASGVEDADTLALLRDFGVDYAQGYAVDGLAPVARLVTPLPAQNDEPPPPVSERARLLRGRLLDHRDRQRLTPGVPGLVEVVRLSA